MSLQDELRTHLEQFHTAPFLFVGSGLSRRYLGLEDWEGLLRRFAELTERPYEYFRSSGDGIPPAIATEIARELHSVWWASSDFSDSRDKYKSEAIGRESALKIEISRYLENISTARTTISQLQEELEFLAQATIDGIITTNWDLLLEDIFPDFETFVGQDELLFSASQGIGEIYKIHGCCSKPNSLIATKDDYERFDKRNPYLAAKLLTVFAEHPVIFVGYSLNDSNISGILQSIALCLTSENIDQLRDRLIIVRWDSSEESYRWQDSTIVTHGFSIPVKTVTTASFKGIFECLSNLPRKFPARILRRLKEHVYELVHDNDPADRLHVMDIDDDTDVSRIKVVYGVGLKVEKETKEVRLSSDPDALPVRLSDDPNAPILPFSSLPVDAEYATPQDELDAYVRTWRSDNYAYIARSRLKTFYAKRAELKPTHEALKCLLISSMYHHAPIHYWAKRIGRAALIPIVREEVRLDLHPRVRDAARLAFAIGMSDGDALLQEIAKRSRHRVVRQLADRFHRQLIANSTIHAEYRSPARSIHQVGDSEVVIDTGSVFNNVESMESILSYLALENDQKTQARLKQLDAYFYGTGIR
jgi:hypothetical protein